MSVISEFREVPIFCKQRKLK